MAPGFNIYNNICGNQWMQMFTQGLGILGGNSAGYGNSAYIGNLLGGNPFTNCSSEVNYDAMAGYGVVNALFGVAGQAYAAHQANKEPEVNYTQEISNINKEIDTKTKTKLNLTNEINELNNSLKNINEHADVKAKYEAWKNASDEDKANLEREYKEAKDSAERAINAQITTKNNQIKTLDEEIKQLEAKRDRYQAEVDKKILDRADRGKLQRAGKDCLEQTYDNDNPASERQLSRAFYEFNQATNISDKRTYAKKVIEMYDSNLKLEDANSSNKQGYKLVQKWLTEHPEETK